MAQRGQAAVESALTLPLTVFIVLGTLQLFMMLQARIMAQYAIARAARAGSLNHGDCDAMTQAAIAALLPTFHSFLKPGGSDSAKYVAALTRTRLGNKFEPGLDDPYNDTILWMHRELTRAGNPYAIVASGVAQGFPGSSDTEDSFDLPYDPTAANSPQPLLLELRMVYWYPMRIPFANWVMSAMFLAKYGLGAYTHANPLMPVQGNANWQADSPSSVFEDTNVPARLQALFALAPAQYSFPIQTTYVTRMMTPPRVDGHPVNDCWPPPAW